MPNHFHAIVEILFSKKEKAIEELNTFKSPSQTIRAIIRRYKGATTKNIKEIIFKEISTGELQFVLTKKEFPPIQKKGELQFAPTKEFDLSKSIWQRDYYEHIIRDEKSYQNISNYIINNSAK